MSRATIENVAARAGVSIKTVSRVVNKEPNVREVTRERVLKAVEDLNYRPNPSARSLAGKRSYLIGLLYDNPGKYDNPGSNYIINIQQGVLRTCKSQIYDLLIHPCDYRSRTLSDELNSLIDHSQLDGLILAPPLSDMDATIEAIQRRGIPVVGISPGDEREYTSAVYTNDRDICARMTEYLVSLGHTRIAFISGHPDHKALVKRYSGYRDGLRDAGLKFFPSLVLSGDNSFASGEECARRLLGGRNPPTAVFACNDDMAAGVIRIAHQMGIRVPDDLSVAGFDDTPLAKVLYPTLTTVRQPVEAMAERVAEMLIDRMHSRPPVKEPQTIASALVVRESTGPVPAPRNGRAAVGRRRRTR